MAKGSLFKDIAKDGTVSWRVRVDMVDPVTGKRRQPQRTYKTKREAEAGLAQWLVEIEHGTAVERSTMTLGAYLAYWLDSVAQHRVRPTTLTSYRQIIRHRIVPMLGQMALQRLTPAQVQAIYGQLLDGGRRDGRGRALSPRSVRYTHAVLRMALQDAVKLGLVPRNVCDAATPPKAARPQVEYWGIDDMRRFLRAARRDRYSTLWILALRTGMRRGELLGLRWQDVDLDQAVLHVRQSLVQSGGVMGFQEPKTSGGRRSVTLDDASVAALREHRARQLEERLKAGALWQGEGHDLVFTTERGTPPQPSNINRRFTALIARAGAPRIPFHGMRHSHATMLLTRGVHPKVVAERLGHAGIAITLQTYSHVVPGLQRQAADAVEQALGDDAGNGEEADGEDMPARKA